MLSRTGPAQLSIDRRPEVHTALTHSPTHTHTRSPRPPRLPVPRGAMPRLCFAALLTDRDENVSRRGGGGGGWAGQLGRDGDEGAVRRGMGGGRAADSPRSRRNLLGSLTPRRWRGRAGGRASSAGAERRWRGAAACDPPRRNRQDCGNRRQYLHGGWSGGGLGNGGGFKQRACLSAELR